ncbi:hypothetical protein [Microcoleus sp. Pol10D4]|uniref:hypothetical protein n=1 Tax=Microcoleus sp. Pol10D4 TaxID=3055387 RepID=UPI002FD631FA
MPILSVAGKVKVPTDRSPTTELIELNRRVATNLASYLQLLRRILWWQSTRVFLASVDIVAIVGETQFEEFKQLKGEGRSHKNV